MDRAVLDTEPDIRHILPTDCLVDVAAQDVVKVVRGGFMGVTHAPLYVRVGAQRNTTPGTSSFRYVGRMSWAMSQKVIPAVPMMPPARVYSMTPSLSTLISQRSPSR